MSISYTMALFAGSMAASLPQAAMPIPGVGFEPPEPRYVGQGLSILCGRGIVLSFQITYQEVSRISNINWNNVSISERETEVINGEISDLRGAPLPRVMCNSDGALLTVSELYSQPSPPRWYQFRIEKGRVHRVISWRDLR